jgi:hypothetical protein
MLGMHQVHTTWFSDVVSGKPHGASKMESENERLSRETAKLACVDLVATIHKSLFAVRVHAGATFEVEAPYPLSREFEWQGAFHRCQL